MEFYVEVSENEVIARALESMHYRMKKQEFIGVCSYILLAGDAFLKSSLCNAMMRINDRSLIPLLLRAIDVERQPGVRRELQVTVEELEREDA